MDIQMILIKNRALNERSVRDRIEDFMENVRQRSAKSPGKVLGIYIADWAVADVVQQRCNEENIPFYHVAEGDCTFSTSYLALYESELRR